MSVQQPRVFISYQRADESFAWQVREHLTTHGVRTWMDQYDIPVGAYWPDEIDKGLGGSDIVVGILSPDAVESRNVKNEWDWAIQHEKRLVLLQYRPCDIPHRYISINFIDASGPDQTHALATLLVTFGIAELAGEQSLADGAIPDSPQRIRHLRRAPQRRFPDEPQLAGRDDAKTRLDAALDGLLAERGQLVLLGGEAGIGKSMLATWLGWAAEERGAIVLTGGCYDLSTTPPYGPWLEIIRAWPEGGGARAVPDALRGGEALARLASQTALFDLVADFLIVGSEWRPLVLVLEDLHWADQATLDLLRHLVRPLADARIMLVATYRDEEITRMHPLFPLLPGLAREPNATRLILSRLNASGLHDLIAGRYPLAADDNTRLIDYLRRQTEGNPFFSGEVLAALVEGGAIVHDGDGWRLVNLELVQVPDLVRQVIEGRLARLGDEARRLLGVAAVIGHEAPIDLWVAISGADESALSDTLERATEARIVEELQGGSGFRFTHALIRETLYEGLGLLRRRALHRQVGDALATGNAPDPDAVSHHFLRAGDPRAYGWLIQAAARASGAYAWLTAGERYEQAAALIADDADRLREFGWLKFISAMSIRYVDRPRSIRLMDDAAQIGNAAGDFDLAIGAGLMAGFYRVANGDVRRGIDELRMTSRQCEVLVRTVGQAAPEPNPLTNELSKQAFWEYECQQAALRPDRAVVIETSIAAVHLCAAGYLAEARDLAEQLAEVWHPRFDTDGDVALGRFSLHWWGDLYHALAAIYYALGRPEDSEHARDVAIRAYESIPHYVMLSITHGSRLLTLLRYNTDQLARRRAVVTSTNQATSQALGALPSGTSSGARAAPLLLVEGAWQEAHDILPAAAAREGNQRSLPAMSLNSDLVRLHRWQGRPGEAREIIMQVLPDGPATVPGDHQFLPALAIIEVAASLALDDGDVAAARDWIDCHDRWLAWSGALVGQAEGLLLWSRYSLLIGDLPAAEDQARRAVANATSPRQPLMLVAAQRALGEVLTVTGRHDEAAAQLGASLALADACAAPFERALTLVALAELDIATNGDPREKLAEARAICERLGARPTLERIAALEARLP